MKKHRGSSVRICLALMLGLGIAPALTTAADTPPIVGTWEGTLNPGAQPKQRIVVNISTAQDGSLEGTIDYPDQDVSGIMITAITYKAPTLHFETSEALYDGTMDKTNSQITGTWKQGVEPVSLVLKRTA